MSEQNAAGPEPMEQVHKLTQEYAWAHVLLVKRVQQLQQKLDAAKRAAMPAIQDAVHVARETREELHAAIETYPELWEGKRRTVVIDGVRVGMTKGKGKLVWEDDAQVVRLIRKHFHNQSEVLIQTKEVPVRKALSQLTAEELAKLGVSLEDAGDQVVIKATDSEIDKVVDKLLGAATGEAVEADD